MKCVHSQCHVKLQRSVLGEHLKSECQYRNVKCHHCGQDVTFASMKVRIKYFIENCDLIFRPCSHDLDINNCPADPDTDMISSVHMRKASAGHSAYIIKKINNS